MKRRSFLAMIGLAPVAAVPSVAAASKADMLRQKVSETYEASRGEWALDVEALSADIEKCQQWAGEGVRAIVRRLDDHALLIADV